MDLVSRPGNNVLHTCVLVRVFVCLYLLSDIIRKLYRGYNMCVSHFVRVYKDDPFLASE